MGAGIFIKFMLMDIDFYNEEKLSNVRAVLSDISGNFNGQIDNSKAILQRIRCRITSNSLIFFLNYSGNGNGACLLA